MVKRNQKSSIKKLPPEIRAEIDKLSIQHGWEIDDLVDYVRSKGGEVSRSAMGRYTRNLHLDVEAAAEKLNRAKEISTALVERFGDKPDNELARANIQMLHGQIFDMILEEEQVVEDDDGNVIHTPGDSLRLVRMTKAVQQLLSAEKMNAERVKEIRKMAVDEERERASKSLDAAARKGEINAEAAERAKRAMGWG